VRDEADLKFLQVYFDNGATSGDNRLAYLRFYITGAGGGGECVRIFTTVKDVAGGTAHGAHISLNFGDTGTLTGLGVAMRATLHIANQGTQAGTLAAIQAEIWSDGTTSDPAGCLLSCIRIVNGGDTGKADVDDDAAALDFQGWGSGTGNMVYVHAITTPGAAAASIKIRIGSTPYYLYAWAAEGTT
jgi:hypothetical protein